MPADPAWNHVAVLLADLTLLTLAGYALYGLAAAYSRARRRRAHPDHPQRRPRSHVHRLTPVYDQDRSPGRRQRHGRRPALT